MEGWRQGARAQGIGVKVSNEDLLEEASVGVSLSGGSSPQRVGGEIPLASPCRLQLDERPARGVKRAHERDAHAEYH